MLKRISAGTVALAAALLLTTAAAQAFDETKYPDWSGQWKKPPGIGNQWDQTKRPGGAQQAPQGRSVSLRALHAHLLHQSRRKESAGRAEEDFDASQGRAAKTIREGLAPRRCL